MERYESPTIEVAGGVGNHIEPQTVALVLVLAVGLALVFYLAAVTYTTTVETAVVIHLAAFVKTIGPVN